jgi:outer membrane protease
MKNIAVFTALVIILWTLPCPQVRGQGHTLSALITGTSAGFPYGLTLAASTGFLYGYGEEIVYKYAGKETYLSQLLWNMKPLFYYGAALDFSRIRPLEKPGFFGSLSLKFGFPSKTGGMEDRDWMTMNDELTNYSLSDNYTNGAFLLDLFLGASLPLGDFALIKLQWSFSLMSFQWAGRDGYYQYSSSKNVPLDDSVGITPYYGVLILYAQNWLITSPGLAVQLPLSRHFRAELLFQISPFIFCNARDDHILRNLEFLDYVSGGLYLEPGGKFAFSFRERFELSLYGSYRYIRGGHGESYERSTGTGTGLGQYLKSEQDAGAAWYAFDSGLTFKVRL